MARIVCFVFSSLQRKDLVDYVKSHYKAPRIVLAGAGGMDHDKLCSFADKYLGSLSASYEDSPVGVPDLPPAAFTGSEVGLLVVHIDHLSVSISSSID